ncbi:MAG: hypothetical protein L0Y42_06515 [Phycisphaerales bacterium]|nr:hypothetical protein [Phycisphaerales bacterium]
MKGCGCLIVLVTGVLGLFFWPLWLVTVVGAIFMLMGGQRTVIVKVDPPTGIAQSARRSS